MSGPVDTDIRGRDLSKYDDISRVEPAFVILNVEDPGFAAKVNRAADLGVPWGVYLWIYAGVRPAVVWAADRWRSVGRGEPVLGLWADYEEAGVTPDQLADFFAQCDTLGLRSGYYASPGALAHGPFLTRPYWLAAYPWQNGTYPGLGALWASSRPRDFVLWQYESVPDGDKNSVTDPDWWASLGAPSVPAPEDDTMKIWIAKGDGPGTQPAYRCWDPGPGMVRQQISAEEAFGPVLQAEAFGGSVLTDKGQPFVWPQATIDAIPLYTPPTMGGGGVPVDTTAVEAAFGAVGTAVEQAQAALAALKGN